MSISHLTSRARLVALGGAAALALLAGCTPSEKPASPEELAKADASSSAAAAKTTAKAARTISGPPCAIDAIKVEGAANTKPTVTIPTDCSAPTGLLSKDLTPGTGAALKAGDTIEAHYHLTTFTDLAFKQSSYDAGRTFNAVIGGGQVIKGWDQGLVGVKAGARRLLVVPPDLGYGPAGQRDIGPNETLIFVVDVVKVTPGSGS